MINLSFGLLLVSEEEETFLVKFAVVIWGTDLYFLLFRCGSFDIAILNGLLDTQFMYWLF